MQGIKTGLFLGKFTILHAGHQFVMDTALREMDRLVVLIYDATSSTPIPLDVRASWIEKIYAGSPIEVVKGWCGPECTGYTGEIMRIQNEYIVQMTQGMGITHFYSSELYGDHVSKALHCINRTVDMDRMTFPISASVIQQNPYFFKEYLHPLVYEDLITNVVFLGAPSTGKTTIARELAREYSTVWMPEFGREYWGNHQVSRRLELWQLTEIAREHLRIENSMLHSANRYLFTDTNAITTYLFSLDYHGTAANELIQLAKAVGQRYDLVFLCADDIPYENTWDRSGDSKRHVLQQKTVSYLNRMKIPYITLKGSIDARIHTVKNILSKHNKWTTIGDLIFEPK